VKSPTYLENKLYLDLSPDCTHGGDGSESPAGVAGHLLQGHGGQRMWADGIRKNPGVFRDGAGTEIATNISYSEQ